MNVSCETLIRSARTHKQIAKGNQSIVYDLGEYVVRVGEGNVNKDLLQKASDAGITPKLLAVEKCDGQTYVLMEKLTTPFTAAKHGKQMARLITDMILAGIFHNDIHAENLMVKNNRLFLIDFENATWIRGLTQTQFDTEMKYHTSYTDETYSRRIPILFTPQQQAAIQTVRNRLP